MTVISPLVSVEEVTALVALPMEQTMAKKAEKSPTQAEDTFIELMMVAAEFAKEFGGIEQAKKALEVTGKFIERAGNVPSATKALDVLDNLKSKIAE